MNLIKFGIISLITVFSVIGQSINLQKISDSNGTPRAYFLSGLIWSSDSNMETSETGNFPDIVYSDSTPIFIRSPGGNLLGPDFLLNWLERQIKINSGRKPKIVLFHGCMSSCIVFLAGVNQLSKQGKIDLEMDDEMTIGFHGSDFGSTGRIYTTPDTTQIRIIEKHGGDHDWLIANGSLFTKPVEDYMAELKATDPKLKGSNLVDYATLKPRKEIVEIHKSLQGFRNQILRRGVQELDENWIVRIKN